MVVNEELVDEVLPSLAHVRDELSDTCSTFGGEVELHMACMLPEPFKEFLVWCPENGMDFVNLVELIISGEERDEGQDLEEDTADSPKIHFISVVAVSEETLRCSVPSRGYVFGERLLRIKPTA